VARAFLTHLRALAGSRRAVLAAGAFGLFGLGLGLGALGGAYLVQDPAPGTVRAAVGNPIAWADPGVPPAAERGTRPPVAQTPGTGPAPEAAPARPHDVPLPRAKPETLEPAGGFAHGEAEPVAVPPGAAKLAIVVDDLGLSRARTQRAIALPPAVTLSFLAYADGLPALTGAARAAGHEVLAHVPMQPKSPEWDAGCNVLRADLPDDELRRRLRWALDRVDGAVGVNNHMGSAFTPDRSGMRTVLRMLKARGLMFLDSRTTPESAGEAVARELGVAFAGRDVFLDNAKDAPAIRESLAEAARIARAAGTAVAIGHPYPVTFEVLEAWIPKARAQGIQLVPISAVTTPFPGQPAQTAARGGDAGP